MKTKTIIKTYYPQSVDLPPGIERNILCAGDMKIIEEYKSLSKQDMQPIDTHTLFYDIFFTRQHLICIGPPFYGFSNPLVIKCEGKRLKFEIYPRHDFISPSVILINMDQPRSCNLEFTFQEFTIDISYTYKPLPLTKTMLTMVTLQKDNLPVWIKDWCSYHTRAYGVERIVLYDNGSKYWTELAELLANLGENLEIILINWPYKYGYLLSHRSSHWYKYCRPGSLSHYHLAFGSQTEWCINLDIDEYLYLNHDVPLKTYLAAKTAIQPTIPIYSYLFPMGQVRIKQQARFYHLLYRYKLDYRPREKALKYVCQPTKVLAMDVHHSRLYTPKLLLKAILFKQPRVFWLRIFFYRVLFYLITFPFLRRRRQEKKHVFNTNQARKNSLYFFHFRDLYSGWRDSKRNLLMMGEGVDNIDSEHLIKDRRVIEKAIEIGMME